MADNTESARLGPAAQQLVDALENFIASLVSPEEIRKDGAQSEEGVDTFLCSIRFNT